MFMTTQVVRMLRIDGSGKNTHTLSDDVLEHGVEVTDVQTGLVQQVLFLLGLSSVHLHDDGNVDLDEQVVACRA